MLDLRATPEKSDSVYVRIYACTLEAPSHHYVRTYVCIVRMYTYQHYAMLRTHQQHSSASVDATEQTVSVCWSRIATPEKD